MPYTNGFCGVDNKLDHYDNHGNEFRASNPDIYETMADQFLGGPKPASTQECYRNNQDRVRYNPRTEEFGVLDKYGYICAYFKPKKSVHRLPTNLKYFNAECLAIYQERLPCNEV